MSPRYLLVGVLEDEELQLGPGDRGEPQVGGPLDLGGQDLPG
jgi:hypothetical protein